MKKIVFLDIDGTIRDFDGYIPESAKTAVAAARSNGHKVCICTGRPLCHIEPRILAMDFDGIVSGSGSYVTYQGTCVRHKYITQFTYLTLCNELAAQDCVLELHTYQAAYLLRQSLKDYETVGQTIQESLGREAQKLTVPPTLIDSFLDVYKIEKILYFSRKLSTDALKEKWGTSFYIVPTSIPCGPYFAGEITPTTVDKGEGIRAILKAGNFTPEDVIAIGDSDNDVEMLRMAGRGIAMGNGNMAAKKAADYTTAPLREDGLYQAFLREGLL